MVLAIFLITALVASAFADEGAAAQKFPFVGKVTQDSVNIRAGNNQNFEILSKLNSGNLALVAEESFGWYKIKLPQSAHCYVSRDFIEKKGNEAVSKASNLNLRARPDKESSILGQIKKCGVVNIAGEDAEGWYEILPPEGCYGWVKADFVEFDSYDMTKLEEKIAEKTKTEKKKPEKLKRGFLWW